MYRYMISKHILLITFLDKPELIIFGTQLTGFTQFQTIQFSISRQFFVYTQLNVKTVLFQTTQFRLSTQFKC